jgi:signal transduction histidine kinase
MERKNKLFLTVALFVASLFFLITAAAWFILNVFSQSIQENLEKVYHSQAQSVGEQIGAQFFERYADVQAMANVMGQTLGILPEEQIQEMLNSYVELYRLYDLIMVTDNKGNLVAVNNKDMAGYLINVSALKGANYSTQPWFANPHRHTFTENAARRLQGAFFYIAEPDLEILSISKDSTPKALFSTVIKKNGKEVGVIATHARLDWLTQEVREQHAKLVQLGMGATSLRVLDASGKKLADFGPLENRQMAEDQFGIRISVPIESSRFPLGLNWKIELVSPRSDVRTFAQYWKTYYILLAFFFVLATALVAGYFGKQFKALSRQYAEAKAVQGELEYRVKERTLDLEENIKELKRMQDRIIDQEKMAALGIMATGMAHEIRNPLNIVLNSAQLLQEHFHHSNGKEISEKEAGDFAEMIVKHSSRIESLVKAILLSARKDHDVSEIVNVNDLLGEVVESLGKAFEMQHGFPIKLLVHKMSKPAIISIGKEDLRRVFVNLIDNALFSVLKKWGAERISQARIDIRIRQLEQDITIEIQDNGLGISEENRKNIFVPFFTTKDPGQGTGLGLVICRDILRNHGGTLEVESEEGEYCTFILKLPMFVLKS